jgi:hypothetical protein
MRLKVMLRRQLREFRQHERHTCHTGTLTRLRRTSQAKRAVQWPSGRLPGAEGIT